MIGETGPSAPSRQSIATHGLVWVNVERPTAAEADALVRDFRLLRGDVEAALGRGESSGVWRRDHYVLIVAQVPVLASGRHQGRILASPVSIFAARDFLITVHAGEVRPLVRMFRQCETDDRAREAAFAVGVTGLVYAVIQRLVDAAASARARIERAIAAQEEGDVRSANLQSVGQIAHLRTEARGLWRLAAPLPALVRSIAAVEPIATGGDETWERVERRAERLVQTLEDDLSALDGAFLAISAAASLRGASYLREITVVAALTLPVIAIGILVGLPLANPFAAQPGAYAFALALAGATFLVILVALKRRGMI
jgi:magnesium transporter